MGAVARLIHKDWSLNRRPIALYALAAVGGGTLATRPGGTARGLGLTLILNVLIGLSFHLPFGTILGERDRKTLAFAMSLPIAPCEYAAAKLFANLLLFCIPASAAVTALGLTTTAEADRAALLRLLLLGLLAWVELFALAMGVALVSGSLGWTIAALLGMIFIFGNGTLQLGPHLPGVVAFVGDAARGGLAFAQAAAALAMAALATLATTLYLQGRKTSFL